MSNEAGKIVEYKGSKTINNERVIFCDVDDTLVMHNWKEGDPTVFIPDELHEQNQIQVCPNESMIRLVKEESQRGAFIVVWSRGGFEWAERVVKAIGLYKYVNQIMSKPLVYLDDKDVSEWLKDRVYISPDTRYKR